MARAIRTTASACSTLAPWRRREAGLSRDQLVRPHHDLPAILPLYGDRLVADLISPFVNGEVAQNSRGPQAQQRLAELVGVETPGPLHGVHQEPARGVATR